MICLGKLKTGENIFINHTLKSLNQLILNCIKSVNQRKNCNSKNVNHHVNYIQFSLGGTTWRAVKWVLSSFSMNYFVTIVSIFENITIFVDKDSLIIVKMKEWSLKNSLYSKKRKKILGWRKQMTKIQKNLLKLVFY